MHVEMDVARCTIEYVPDTQLLHEVNEDKACAVEYLPVPHDIQFDCNGLLYIVLYVAIGQAKHVFTVILCHIEEKYPGEQDWHDPIEEAPVTDE
jgi:hypothetical protein